ncbi:hypothetical protein TNIN_121491 [Trichonephila inaurata madagascariensis]|uniref:Uncharacterized protein n=1 Tax=Trichonephila inaurata madagascariensis TaxID=2747483 RepID=A0A8X7C7P9_9ARAC|nr:hypothetical protein TNIN_121491 [Trichonephila inaurata madagascariensis]
MVLPPENQGVAFIRVAKSYIKNFLIPWRYYPTPDCLQKRKINGLNDKRMFANKYPLLYSASSFHEEEINLGSDAYPPMLVSKGL